MTRFGKRLAMGALLCSSVLMVPHAASGQAITFTTRTFCKQPDHEVKHYIVYAGRSMKGQFKGSWADYIKSVSAGSGVTATLSNPISNWSNSTLDVTLRADADAYGPKGQVSITVEPTLQPRYSKSVDHPFWVISAPALMGSIVPKADYYETVDVVLTGRSLKGANVATATARVDATHPAAGYGGAAAQISNGAPIPAAVVGIPTSTQATVRLSLPQKFSMLSVDIKLTANNADPCLPFGAGPGADPPPVLSRRLTLAVPAPYTPPAVQSIDVINARVGRDAEFTITLDKSVPKFYPGMSVWFKMSPSTNFSAVSGDISYNATGEFNRATVNIGERVTRFKLRVVSLPPGAVNVGTVYLQTWIGDKTKNQPPFFFQKEFTVAQ